MPYRNVHIFKKLVDYTSDAVFILRADVANESFYLGYCNKAYEQLFQTTFCENVDKELSEFVPEKVCDGVRRKLLFCLKSTQPLTYEEFVEIDNNTYTFLSEIFLLEERDQKYIVGISKDISELQKQKELLKESENKLESIVNSSNNNIYYLSLDYKILFVNEAAQRHCMKLNGCYYQIGDYIKNYMHPDDYNKGVQFVQKLLDTRETISHENVIKYPDGDIAWFYRRYYPTFNSKGKLIGFVTASTDITEIKKKELEILSKDEQLREIAKIQSHEIRRPLANILGLVYVMKEDCVPAAAEHVNLLEKSAKELDDVIKLIVFKTQGLNKNNHE